MVEDTRAELASLQYYKSLLHRTVCTLGVTMYSVYIAKESSACVWADDEAWICVHLTHS